jgi:hypothetical protein
MMTPKEKAIELVDKFIPYTEKFHESNPGNGWEIDVQAAKKCALIAVDEIIDATTKRWGGVNPETGFVINNVEVNPYWVEVKQEIEKL